MALWRCILGVVVLLSVSVSADQGPEDAVSKLQEIDPKPDLDLNLDQGDLDQAVAEDQNEEDIPDSEEDEESDDQDHNDEDILDSEEDEDSEDQDQNLEDEDSEDDEQDNHVSDQEDNLSVAQRLELVNQNLEGDEESVIEDGDVAVSRPRHVQKRNADRCTKRPWWMFWKKKCAWRRRRGKVYVPYVIAKDYSSSQVRLIKQAFSSFARKTCIRFVRNYRRRILWWKRWKYRDYLYIHSGSGCWSYIGRQRGKQKLSLKRNGCVYLGTIQHELLHALGFHHEHKRSDRDRYIKVLWGNIQKGREHNFRRTSTLNLGTPYDYGSVMHYRKTTFSKNGRPTLMARRRNVTFGNARSMSAWDIRRVNRLYCR